MRHREEVVNTILAEVLGRYGSSADPEILARVKKRRHSPDIFLTLHGFRCVIEGRYGDISRVKASLRRTITKRLESGIAQIAVGLVYPGELRESPFSDLPAALAEANYDYCVMTEASYGSWHSGRIEDLLSELRRAHELLVSDNAVQVAADELSDALDTFSNDICLQEAIIERVALIVGVTIPQNEDKNRVSHMAAKIAGLTIANAFIFQEQLACSDRRVKSLRQLINSRADLVGKSLEHWGWIVETIDYVPIFSISMRVLKALPAGSSADEAVKGLFEASQSICAKRAALRHDLMGRLYHKLLHEAKYLGTYYTSIPAATLLMGLTFHANKWNINWAESKSIGKMRIADLACGTGTLLVAAAQAISDLFIRTRYKFNHEINPANLADVHKYLVEGVLHGYDVVSSAVHLTASTLALSSPEVVFDRMRLFVMPFGVNVNDVNLGSIDFAKGDEITQQIDLLSDTLASQQVSGRGEGLREKAAHIPMLDLCVMNPPFTRSVGGNLLFGSLQDSERKILQKELARVVRETPLSASSTAGLGSVFVAVANQYLKQGGKLALVLPAALVSGVAWKKTRNLLDDIYSIEYVITSHEADRWNFSENTDLSEVLVIARKRHKHEATGEINFVNLWINPRTSGEALALIDTIVRSSPAKLGGPSNPKIGISQLNIGNRKYGEILSVPQGRNGQRWTGWEFAQTELIRCARYLIHGKMLIPTNESSTNIPMCRLDELADIGPDRRDIYDGFELTEIPTNYAAVWGHDSETMKSIALEPNKWLSPLNTALRGRNLRDANLLWSRSGTLLIGERLWLTTQRIVAAALNEPVLSNVWWPVALKDPTYGKALAMWLNSSYGLLILIAMRTPTRGPWIQLKKPIIEAMHVVNLKRLKKAQIRKLAEGFDRLQQLELLPLPKIAEDPVRIQIDTFVAEALNIQDAAPLRQMLSIEPVITNCSIAVSGLMPEDEDDEETGPQLVLSLFDDYE